MTEAIMYRKQSSGPDNPVKAENIDFIEGDVDTAIEAAAALQMFVRYGSPVPQKEEDFYYVQVNKKQYSATDLRKIWSGNGGPALAEAEKNTRARLFDKQPQQEREDHFINLLKEIARKGVIVVPRITPSNPYKLAEQWGLQVSEACR